VVGLGCGDCEGDICGPIVSAFRGYQRHRPSWSKRRLKRQVDQVRHVRGVVEHDMAHGLFGSIEDKAVALAFDNLLDHARDYLDNGQVAVGGVVAGVDFEDAMRRLRGKLGIEPSDIKIDLLISELQKRGTLTVIEAKRAKSAAGVRTSATHARWDDFSAGDVEECIRCARINTEKLI
jgi:hypothetical protein